MAFSHSQYRSIEVIERVMSVLSLMGTFFIIITYTAFPYFRKPINRLVLYASLGNLLCNVGTLISVSGLKHGQGSSLCQFQAFVIQMFLPADSLWTFCMALNVWLTFYKNFTAVDLRRLEKWYIIGCYGLPLIPSLIYLMLEAGAGMKIYGPATLWCWVAVEYDWMRIAFFYGPVWIVIIITFSIYIHTGKDILKQRAALRSFSNRTVPASAADELNPFAVLSAVTKVTEIKITTEEANPSSGSSAGQRDSFSSTRKLSNPVATVPVSPNYFVAGANGGMIAVGPARIWPPVSYSDRTATITAGDVEPAEEQLPPKTADTITRSPSFQRRRNNAAMRANTAAWGYAKVAMLMFVALIVVWVPSTVNRLYALVRPDHPIYALNVMAAAVLPMQGFWNCLIYVSTSWGQCKDAYDEIRLFLTGHQIPSRVSVSAGFGTGSALSKDLQKIKTWEEREADAKGPGKGAGEVLDMKEMNILSRPGTAGRRDTPTRPTWGHRRTGSEATGTSRLSAEIHRDTSREDIVGAARRERRLYPDIDIDDDDHDDLEAGRDTRPPQPYTVPNNTSQPRSPFGDEASVSRSGSHSKM